MAANYLHGVETIEVERGPRPVRTVKSAVIGLIGTAPAGPVNATTLTLSEKDAAAFGPQLPGFTIPQALTAIYDHGAGTVVVINVLDPTSQAHKSTIPEEAITLDLATDSARLKYPAVANVVVKSADGATTHVAGQDYALDASYGKITRLKTGKIAAGANLKVSYDYADPSKVTAADIIGAAANAAGNRTGLKALQDTYNKFGFFAKLLIAPGFCTQNTVAAEMAAMADKLDAIAYVDAPIGTAFADALAGRGPAGTINFNTSSDRVRLCYPHVMVADGNGGLRYEPLSSRAAGLRAKVDNDKGFWWSSSNQ
ncbi:phage tail sheath subtilisin-like domain-containing protein, partial [Chromobacterium violaceum]